MSVDGAYRVVGTRTIAITRLSEIGPHVELTALAKFRSIAIVTIQLNALPDRRAECRVTDQHGVLAVSRVARFVAFVLVVVVSVVVSVVVVKNFARFARIERFVATEEQSFVSSTENRTVVIGETKSSLYGTVDSGGIVRVVGRGCVDGRFGDFPQRALSLSSFTSCASKFIVRFSVTREWFYTTKEKYKVPEQQKCYE